MLVAAFPRLEGVRFEQGELYVLVTSDEPLAVMSTAPVGAELRQARSLLNITVAANFSECLVPEGTVDRVVAGTAAPRPVVGMLTAVPGTDAVVVTEQFGSHRVTVIATVGLGHPNRPGEEVWERPNVGTINVISLVEGELSPTALAECLAVTVEAKALAVYESGAVAPSGGPATGTSTDAVIVASTQRGNSERYAGVITPVGFILGKAVRRAVGIGAARWLADAH